MSWNQRTRTLCGLATDAPATFDMFFTCMHPEDRKQISAAMVHAAIEGERLSSECRVIDGSERWVLIEGCTYLSDGPAVFMTGTVRDVSKIKEADTQHEMLLQEMEHRLHNIFTIISSVISLSQRTVDTSEELARALRTRIAALDRAYGLLPAAIVLVQLRQVIETELAAFIDLAAIRISGPPIDLGRNQAIAMHLIVHELTTNALKYGALSHPAGRLEIHWAVRDDHLELRWTEAGRARLITPTRTGFGSRLLALCARLNLGGDIHCDFDPNGARVALVVPIHRLR